MIGFSGSSENPVAVRVAKPPSWNVLSTSGGPTFIENRSNVFAYSGPTSGRVTSGTDTEGVQISGTQTSGTIVTPATLTAGVQNPGVQRVGMTSTDGVCPPRASAERSNCPAMAKRVSEWKELSRRKVGVIGVGCLSPSAYLTYSVSPTFISTESVVTCGAVGESLASQCSCA